MRFQNKIAIVTGGASGIGAACCARLAEEGAKVLLADFNREMGQVKVAEIRKRGGDALFQYVDLSHETSIQQCADAVAGRVDRLHVLINNAGIVMHASIADTGHDDWDAQIAVNLKAPALMAKALLPLMKVDGGAIVNVSSEAAFLPSANKWVYDATKAGICALTRTMAVEFQPLGIRVNTVAPGFTVTEMHFGQAEDPAARKRELEQMQLKGPIIPRLARPHEIAAAILFLASDDASYITATTLHVDGGRTGR